MMCGKTRWSLLLFLALAVSGITMLYAVDYGAWLGGVVVDSAYKIWDYDMINQQQYRKAIMPDGSGGVIVTWSVEGEGSCPSCAGSIYCQRIDADGVFQWGEDGKLLAPQSNKIIFGPSIVPSGQNEAIVCWSDDGHSIGTNPYAQKINFSGDLLWDSCVMLMEDLMVDHHCPNLIADGCGGAVVSCVAGVRVKLQRVSGDGELLWAPLGLVLNSARVTQTYPWASLASDGGRGAIVVWGDPRNEIPGFPNNDIYAQRVDSLGVEVWGSTDVAICTASGHQRYPVILPDGGGGAFIAWEDLRSTGLFLYAQRIAANGSALWQADGVAVCESARNSSKLEPVLISDGQGGIIVAWRDNRWDGDPGERYDWDVYAQRMDGNGNRLWNPNGVPLCNQNGNQLEVTACSDGQHGAIVAWVDPRNGDKHIYAQRIDQYGNVTWQPDGIPINTDADDSRAPYACNDGATGSFIYSFDVPDYSNATCYVQKIDSYFDFPAPQCTADYQYLNVATGQRVYRNFMTGCPAGDLEMLQVALAFDVSDLPRDIEAAELTLEKPAFGFKYWSNGDIVADGPARIKDAAGGTVTTTISRRYFSRNRPLNNCGVIGYDDAVLFNDTAIASELVCVKSPDYTGEGVVNSTDQSYFNLTCGKKRGQTGHNAWFDFTDDGKINSADQAIMTAHAGHAKPPGYLGLISGIDYANAPEVDQLPVASTVLSNNFPNPFNPVTTIEFSLAEDSPVNLSIYNVRGELVRTLVNEFQKSNTYSVMWDGKDNLGTPLASGISFFSLKANGFSRSKKMVLLR